MPIEWVAHRGYAGRHPENTLAAVRAAVELGATWIEIDVQVSRDGHVVLFHDRTLDRVCGVSGAVHERDLAELRALHVHEPDRLGPDSAREPLTALDEVVDLVAAHPDVRLFVEVKRVAIENHGLEETWRAVHEALRPVERQAILISFSFPIMWQAKGKLPLGFILDEWKDADCDGLKELSPEYVFCNFTKIPDDADLSAPWRWVVYEVVDAELAARFHDRGVDLIETFELEDMRAAFAEETS